MSGYALHILAYWIISAIIFLGISHLNLLSAQEIDIILLSVLVGTIYAILPDIDSPSSLIRRLVEKTALILVIILLVGYLVTNYPALIYAAMVLILMLLFHRTFFNACLTSR